MAQSWSMYADRYGQQFVDRAKKRLAHVDGHLERGFSLPAAIRNIKYNLGNPNACLGELSDHALASAVAAWFRHGDLHAMRQWCYVAAGLDRMLLERTQDRFGPFAKVLGLLKPLLSNDPELIGWFAAHGAVFFEHLIDDPGTYEHLAYQAFLALRGNGDALVARSEAFLGGAAAHGRMRDYAADYRFWAALGQRDAGAMQRALEELVEPRLLLGRENDESGYTAFLISTPAVVYAKIAWLHGYEVSVASPFVPKEWLPMTPLPMYSDHYDFLARG